MGWQKATNQQTFINPYNFVGLGSKVVRKKPEKQNGNMTGVISCTLTAKTPLAISDHETEIVDASKHRFYDFFQINGVPVIPGSEIRGVIRSAFEAVSNSCMSVCNSNILSARHPLPRQAGLVQFENGKWTLYKAKRYKIKMPKDDYTDSDTENTSYKTKVHNRQTFIEGTNYTTGSKVFFTPGSSTMKNGYVDRTKVKSLGGTSSGVLLLWEYIANKRYNSIFVINQSSDEVQCSNLQKAVEDFAVVMQLYTTVKEDESNPYENLQYSLKKDGQLYPVWYEMAEEIVYLSPACISRTVFNNRLENLLGSYKKCISKDDLCPACSLFGMMGDSSFGSKLRFSDAMPSKPLSKEDFIPNITLQELAGPKTSAMEFYTHRPTNALAWNYDYETTGYKGMTAIRKKTITAIRGRKFYFHSQPNLCSNEKTKRNCTVKLVKESISFQFQLYFNNIDIEQLHQLIWLLAIGENQKESKQQHKIGLGKPLGLGSIKITVDNVHTRDLDKESFCYYVNDYDVKHVFEYSPFDLESQPLKEFLKITSTDTTAGKIVTYPVGCDNTSEKDDDKNSCASHQWFTGNRQMLRGTNAIKWNIKHVLPKLTDNELTLPALEKITDKPSNSDKCATKK